MSPDDELLLRRLHQNIQQTDLEPDDPRYVGFDEHGGAFGPDVIRELARDVAWSTDGSVFYMSGLRGSGKSTQLRRLEADLRSQGLAAVRIDAEDYLNLKQPIDVVEFLFFLVGAIGEAVDRAGWLPGDSVGDRTWNRFKDWLAGLPGRIDLTPGAELTTGIDALGISATANLKAELRADARFVARLREFMQGRMTELARTANEMVGNLVAELRDSWASNGNDEWLGLVVLVDSLDHVRGADFQQVRRALIDLFDKDTATITLEHSRTVFTVPPWVHVDATTIRSLANVRINDPDGQPHSNGYDAMRAVLERRCPDGIELSDLLESHQVDRLIADSGGHLRDLLRLVRDSAIAADDVPLTDAALDRGRQQVRDGLLPIADDELECLREVSATHRRPLPTQDAWENLAGLFDRHLILGYKNGETWYDVHPLIVDLLG